MTDRYVIPEPGGYQREADVTFGAGTLRPCPHDWYEKVPDMRVYRKGVPEPETLTWYWRNKHGWVLPAGSSFEKPGDGEGTARCVNCGLKREPKP